MPDPNNTKIRVLWNILFRQLPKNKGCHSRSYLVKSSRFV